MEIVLNLSMLEDTSLKLNVEKVGQEFCDPHKMPTDSSRPCYALHFILFGRGAIIDSHGKKYDLSKSDVFLLYKDEKYSYWPDIHDPWSYIWVEFDGEGIDELVSLCGFGKDSIKKHVRNLDDFVMLMRNMYDCYDTSELQSLRCTAYFMLVLGKFIEQELAAKTSQSDIRNRQLLRNILIYINNNHTSPELTTEDIARPHGISVRSLNRLFSDMLGMTPIEYMNAYRIAAACEGIKLWNPSMAQIAKWVGFKDEAYFSRVFKNVKGVSPQEWKKGGMDEDPFAWIKEKGMLFR